MRTPDHRALLAELSAALDAGRPVVVATIVASTGSVPRHPGAKMLVYADGTTSGTVGGGEVEAFVRADAVGTLAAGATRLTRYTLEDPDRGDPGICGGTMTVALEPYPSPDTVFVVGCGHVGRTVIELAHWLGYRTIATDDRADLVSESALPDADVRFVGTVGEAVEANPVTANTSIIVVTRSHELDVQILPTLVATPARYIGVMGSKRRWATTRAALLDAGVPGEAIDRIHVPIGVDIGAETVEEIAVAIMSQVIATGRE